MRPELKTINALKRAANYVQQYGLGGYIQAKRARRFDTKFEKRLGVATDPPEENPESGEIHPDQIFYMPTPYSALVPVLKAAGIGPKTHFLDYGCGAGRVLATAAKLGAASATGVEFQASLVSLARANLKAVKSLSNARTEVIEADATKYSMPPEINLVFFYNPFIGETLRTVVERIRESLERHPRELTVVFFNDSEFRDLIAGANWIRIIDQGVALSKTRWPLPWGIYCTGTNKLS